MGFRDFLNNKDEVNSFLRIVIVVFAFVVAIILLVLMFKSDNYLDKLLPLLTFILGAFLAGAKDSIWGGKKMIKNKKGQLTAILTPQAIATIIGGILGYLIAPQLGQDRTLGIVIGGILGLVVSRFI